MSCCAIMLVKDEADVIEFTVRHLVGQVDYVIVADNLSTDGTRQILDRLVAEGLPVQVVDDPEVGYFQDTKTTDLAMHALRRGYDWVLPCDADEFWYATDGRTISQFLNGQTPDVQIVAAELFNHLPTAIDPSSEETPSPFGRIGWRQREHGALGKVACRTRPDLRIHMGNHSASVSGVCIRTSGLCVRHFSWRSAEQYVRKIRNGEKAYAATSMPESVGLHWRMFSEQTDEDVAGHFRRWFWSPDPYADATLIFDPAPETQGR